MGSRDPKKGYEIDVLDELIAEITVDKYGDDEQLWAFRQAFEDESVVLGAEVRFTLADQDQWRIIDQRNEVIYTVARETGMLDVYESTARWAWAVTVTYNQMNLADSDVADLISDLGFNASSPQAIGRVGKRIVIPPDVAG